MEKSSVYDSSRYDQDFIKLLKLFKISVESSDSLKLHQGLIMILPYFFKTRIKALYSSRLLKNFQDYRKALYDC